MQTDWCCPVTGLNIVSRPDWGKQVSPSFTSSFTIVGGGILYSRPAGYADLESVKRSLALNDKVAESLLDGKAPYVQIEDYRYLKGSSLAARRYFTNQMNANNRLISIVFCNLSTLFSVAVNIGKQFNVTGRPVHIAPYYRDAVRLAADLAGPERLTQAPLLLNQRVCLDDSPRILEPVMLRADEEWDFTAPGFSNQCVLIGESTLLSITRGRLDPSHVPLVKDMRSRANSVLPEGASIQYIVINAKEMEGVTHKARIQFMKALQEWNKEYPCKMFIFYGTNRTMSAAIHLARPLMPFKVRTAREAGHAFELIRQDRKSRAGGGQTLAVSSRRKPPTQEDLDELTAFISRINWEEKGINNQFDVEEGHPLHLLFQSITLIKEEVDDLFEERKQIGEKLIESAKQESIGRLAGGVAHDFNNMLGVILGRAEIALNGLDASHPLYLELKEIQSAAMHSAELTRQLLAYARKQVIAPKVLNLNERLSGMLSMIRRLIGENIDIAWQSGPDLWQVNMDPSQVDQILTNLCLNARDAISGTGKVVIETENVSFDRQTDHEEPNPQYGDYVLLSVSDDGRGMDKESLEHIFEPFYTTKGLAEGTGLGLSTVYGIVRQNRGFIDVSSKPGKGTAFRIYLPRHEGPAAPMVEEEPRKTEPGQGETILLVEDETALMDISGDMLEQLGYNVLSSENPLDAILLAEKYAQPIHLVLTDIVMPEMNGRQLAGRLKENHPGLKILYMSGYNEDIITSQGLLDKSARFLQKPFSIREISLAVRNALDDEKQAG